MKRGYSRSICYIVTVFLLIIGMCQGRIQADFCFEWDKNGQMSAFLDSEEGEVDSYALSADESLKLQKLTLNVKDSRVEGKRILARFWMQLLQAVIFLSCFSVFQRTVEVQALGEGSCTDIIVQYLHQKDGKK